MDNDKYYGIYRGTCHDNSDPENKNRITLLCPQVLSTGISNWAYPVSPITGNSTHAPHNESYTSSFASVGTLGSHSHTVTLASPHSDHIKVPDINQGVWVMFEGGDSNFPLWVGVF
jgi:hypothetical protein